MADSDVIVNIGADVSAALQGVSQVQGAIAAIAPLVAQLNQVFAQLGQSAVASTGQTNQALQTFLNQRVQAAANAQTRIAAGERNAAESAKREWTKIVDPIVSSWGTAITRMVEGTETFRQAIAHIGEAVLQTFVRAIEQMVEKWILKLLVGQAAQQTSAVSQVASLAGLAGAGGVASMAAAPFPIDLGAPAFGAAMASAAMAYASFSAAGGFDVPAGAV